MSKRVFCPCNYALCYSSYAQLPAGFTGFTRGVLLGDPNLRPEFTDTFEAGLELGFLNNRLGIELVFRATPLTPA